MTTIAAPPAASAAAAAPAAASAAAPAAATNKNVLIPISNGTDEGHLGVIVSVLSRYKANIVIAAIDHANPTNTVFRSSGGLTITADETFENVKNAYDWDLIVLPGGRRGAIAYRKNESLKEHIRQHVVKHKKLVGAIGESPAYVLAHIPQVLKDGHTCFPNKEYIQHVDGYAEGKSIVVKDNVVTCQGSGYAFVFAIQLGEMLFNFTPFQAQGVANSLLVDRTLTHGVSYDPPRDDLDRIAARMEGAAAKKAMEKQKQEYNAKIREENEKWAQHTSNMTMEEFEKSLPPGCRLVDKKNKNTRKRKRGSKGGTRSASQKKQRQTTSSVVNSSKIFQWTIWTTLVGLKWRYVSRKHYVPPGEQPSKSGITSQTQLVNYVDNHSELSKQKPIKEGLIWFKSCLKYKQEEPDIDGKALFERALKENPDLASGEFFERIKAKMMGGADSSHSASPKESSGMASHSTSSSADQAVDASLVPVHRAATNVQQSRGKAAGMIGDDRKPPPVSAKSLTVPTSEEQGAAASAGNMSRAERLAAREEAKLSGKKLKDPPSPNDQRQTSSTQAAAASSSSVESPASLEERLAVNSGVQLDQISDEQIMLATMWEPLHALGWTYNADTKRDVYVSPGAKPNPVGKGSLRSVKSLLKRVREEYSLESNSVVARSLEWYDACLEKRDAMKSEIPEDEPLKWLFDQVEKSKSSVDIGPRPDSEEFRTLVSGLRGATASSSPNAAAASPAPGPGSKVWDVHELQS